MDSYSVAYTRFSAAFAAAATSLSPGAQDLWSRMHELTSLVWSMQPDAVVWAWLNFEHQTCPHCHETLSGYPVLHYDSNEGTNIFSFNELICKARTNLTRHSTPLNFSIQTRQRHRAQKSRTKRSRCLRETVVKFRNV